MKLGGLLDQKTEGVVKSQGPVLFFFFFKSLLAALIAFVANFVFLYDKRAIPCSSDII